MVRRSIVCSLVFWETALVSFRLTRLKRRETMPEQLIAMPPVGWDLAAERLSVFA